MGKGWISLNRKIQDHWIWNNHEYAFAWIDLLLLVNHATQKTLVDGKLITIKRGQKLTSVYKLAKRWGWSRKKTYGFLNVLEKDNMIERKSTTKYTIVTVVNYGKFQNPGSTVDTTEDTTVDTTEELQRVHKQQCNNNVSNKEKSDPLTPSGVAAAEEGEEELSDEPYPDDFWDD